MLPPRWCRRPCSSPRATLSDPSAWAREKKKEKRKHFPEKFSAGNRAGIHKTEKLHGALILLCAGGWRVLNRSCDHVLRKTRLSTLQTLVTGGSQIVRLWSASLGGSKGRPITRATDRRERVSERARGDGQGGDADDSQGDSERPTDTPAIPVSALSRPSGRREWSSVDFFSND